jgi:hypothetical protein
MILRITLKYGDKVKSWFVDVIVCRRQAIWENTSIYLSIKEDNLFVVFVMLRSSKP